MFHTCNESHLFAFGWVEGDGDITTEDADDDLVVIPTSQQSCKEADGPTTTPSTGRRGLRASRESVEAARQEAGLGLVPDGKSSVKRKAGAEIR